MTKTIEHFQKLWSITLSERTVRAKASPKKENVSPNKVGRPRFIQDVTKASAKLTNQHITGSAPRRDDVRKVLMECANDERKQQDKSEVLCLSKSTFFKYKKLAGLVRNSGKSKARHREAAHIDVRGFVSEYKAQIENELNPRRKDRDDYCLNRQRSTIPTRPAYLEDLKKREEAAEKKHAPQMLAKVAVAEKKKHDALIKEWKQKIKDLGTTDPKVALADDARCQLCFSSWAAWKELGVPMKGDTFINEFKWHMCQHCEQWYCRNCISKSKIDEHVRGCEQQTKKKAPPPKESTPCLTDIPQPLKEEEDGAPFGEERGCWGEGLRGASAPRTTRRRMSHHN